MDDVIVAGLSIKQKAEDGGKVADRLAVKRPSDQIAVGLGGLLGRQCDTLRTATGAGPAARDARGALSTQKLQRDRDRDRSVFAVHGLLQAFLLLDNQPEKQKDAAFLLTELLPDGIDFLRWSYAEQTTAMRTLLDRTGRSDIQNAIKRLGIADAVENIRARQAEFAAMSEDKDAAHGTAKEATRTVSQAVRRWDSAMRTVVNYLDTIYDDCIAAQKTERDHILQPLAEAGALARARATRGERIDAEPAAATPAPAAGSGTPTPTEPR
ncbi:MAG: DUF6261 family protein [Myxococcota bacterium]|nr:DUF6261 family protein [Myxococcota bacterium]